MQPLRAGISLASNQSALGLHATVRGAPSLLERIGVKAVTVPQATYGAAGDDEHGEHQDGIVEWAINADS